MPKLRTNLINPVSADQIRILKDQVLEWEGGLIRELRSPDPVLDADCEARLDCVLIPGLIDLHVHLSQYRMRGQYEPALLPWLTGQVFPAEARSADPDYARQLADEFFQALFAQGTTTSVIYTAPFSQACEQAFTSAATTGARAFIGMTLMDRNSPDVLAQSTSQAYADSVRLFELFDGCTDLLRYIFTPRFAPTCSLELMGRIAIYAKENNAFIQTHLSENRDELRWVREIFGLESYTEVYDKAGILGPRTLLAHCIHLSDRELDILKAADSKIVHCPDSNFYLKSGEFNYPRIASKGLPIGLGSDVGAGTTLNMLYHAKMANFRQSGIPLLPERLFHHLTLGNAALLGLEDSIGSLEVGKQADFALLRMPGGYEISAGTVSDLVFWGHELPVLQTWVAGKKVYQAGC
jgi:guanine deaminase